MKKLRGSVAAKIIAFLLVGLCAFLFLTSIVGMAVMSEAGVYGKKQDVLKEELFNNISDNYGKMALAYYMSGEGSEYFDNKNFEYGIVKKESLDGVKLTDKSVYAASNFSGPIKEEDLKKQELQAGENTTFDYEYDSGILGMPYCYLDESTQNLVSISEYIYSIEEGIFYYLADGIYYPVYRVDITNADGNYLMLQYDEKQSAYISLNYANDIIAADAKKIIEKNNYVTLDMFDETELNFRTWDSIALDGVQYGMYNIVFASDHYAEKKSDKAYTTDGNGALYLEQEKNTKSETYWIVSQVSEPLKGGRSWNTDAYVRADMLLDIAYTAKYLVLVLMVISFILMIAAGIFSFWAAGYRKTSGKIEKGGLQKIPLDILTAIVFFVEASGLILAMDAMNYFRLASIIQIAICGIGCYMVGMLYLLDFTICIKTGKWWRNTVCYYLFHLIQKNASLMWKGWLVYAGICLYELVFILESSEGALMWCIEKGILFVVLTLILVQMKKLQKGSVELATGNLQYNVDTSKMCWEFKKHGKNLNSIGEGMNRAVQEKMKSERFKTELITNVSHDIKTPLTSIINYVDLLEKEKIENPTAEKYLGVLERQSERLKKLIEDLIEASKASTGNLAVTPEVLDAGVFVTQTVGEFEEKLAASDLELLIKKPEEAIYVTADGRHLWRIIDNLMNNICKYAQPGTRVYLDLSKQEEKAVITFRNTSKSALNISSEELMERFVRGDSSRNTEGSGLGLSIARSLTELMKGSFQLDIDGDLFKTILSFEIVKPETGA